MNLISYFTDLSCFTCGKKYSIHQVQTFCTDCSSPLLANYDLEHLALELDRDAFRHRSRGMWRWHELLPVYDEGNIVTLGEGDTPLLQLPVIGNTLGLSRLYLKEEGQNPTGSFKARGISAAVSKARELGIKKLVIPSAGNAGGALSAYAARGGMQCLIFMPRNSPAANIGESKITGARVELVDGLINVAGKSAQEASIAEGWFNLSTFKEPYRVEGKKIMGYEIAESLGWELPDVIVYPTGGGTGLVGMWKAFQEMEILGWTSGKKKPKMVAVQTDGCAPVVKAFRENRPNCEPWENAHTIATGLCVPHSFADRMILEFIRYSDGTAVSVSDDEIIEAREILARREGIHTCPEGAATLAGLSKLMKQGWISQDATVILFNTASGLKYLSN